MLWNVNVVGGFVVGGDGSGRLTPNFRVREFRRADGSVRAHRELIAALQLLRNRFGRGIKVKDVSADGLGATVAASPVEALLAAADDLEAHHLFEQAEREDDLVQVRIPDPARLPEIGLEQAMETAFLVTADYETNGDPFQQVTGNADEAGMSFGPAQVNFRSGTIEPLFEQYRQADEEALRGCFGRDDYNEWQRVLALGTRQKIAWADSISTGKWKQLIVQPWQDHLQAVGRVERFRAISVDMILRKYGRQTLEEIHRLGRMRPDIRIDHLRCLCALYDVSIQQGGLGKAEKQIEERVAAENPRNQFELVQMAVEERGRAATDIYRADCVSRRVGILKGLPHTATEFGKTSQRANISFYMLRDVRVRDVAALIAKEGSDVDRELDRVAQSLATGSSLLT